MRLALPQKFPDNVVLRRGALYVSLKLRKASAQHSVPFRFRNSLSRSQTEEARNFRVEHFPIGAAETETPPAEDPTVFSRFELHADPLQATIDVVCDSLSSRQVAMLVDVWTHDAVKELRSYASQGVRERRVVSVAIEKKLRSDFNAAGDVAAMRCESMLRALVLLDLPRARAIAKEFLAVSVDPFFTAFLRSSLTFAPGEIDSFLDGLQLPARSDGREEHVLDVFEGLCRRRCVWWLRLRPKDALIDRRMVLERLVVVTKTLEGVRFSLHEDGVVARWNGKSYEALLSFEQVEEDRGEERTGQWDGHCLAAFMNSLWKKTGSVWRVASLAPPDFWSPHSDGDPGATLVLIPRAALETLWEQRLLPIEKE